MVSPKKCLQYHSGLVTQFDLNGKWNKFLWKKAKDQWHKKKQTSKQILYPSADHNQAKDYSPYSITVIIKATTNKSNILHLSSIVIEVIGAIFFFFMKETWIKAPK